MAHNTLSPEHQVDPSGETLVAAVAPLGLPEYVRHELEQHTESAGEILLVEASVPGSTEHPERSLRVLDALMAHAPETDDRQYAAVEKLGFLLEEKNSEADAQTGGILAALIATGVLREEPALRLAELLVKHGLLEEALNCFDIASRRYLDSGVEELNDMILLFEKPLIGRAVVREKLGYAPDEFDSEVRDFVTSEARLKGLINSATAYANWPGPHLVRPEHRQGHQVLCSRQDFALAVEGGILDGGTAEIGADAYFQAGERVIRGCSREHPDLDWYMVLFSVEEIREFARERGGDPSDRDLHGEWSDTLAPDDPWLRPWPPERNQRCWCASGRKYKKCCGSPNSR